jgi:hypothetical protein
MDPIVQAALKKWPHVPHCYGWLGLDGRGNWWMRDDATQACGPFVQAKGSRIEHTALREFIGRNYAVDPLGCWYFQNGPQRVYVELEAAPWVWRLHASSHPRNAPQACSHTGLATSVDGSWLDEHGRLYLSTPLGLGSVHTLDMALAAEAVELGVWEPQVCTAAQLAVGFAFCTSPAQLLNP